MDLKGMMISSQIDGRVKKCRTGALSYRSLVKKNYLNIEQDTKDV